MGNATRTMLVLAGFLLIPVAAQATEYPYCMTYNEGWSGAIERCDFSTIDQCRASASGLNGYCAPNRRLAWNNLGQPSDVTMSGERKKHIRQ